MKNLWLYYEKRRIKDIKGNIFYIWSVYKLDELDRAIQVCVFDNKDEFNHFRRYHNIRYRKYTKRGMK